MRFSQSDIQESPRPATPAFKARTQRPQRAQKYAEVRRAPVLPVYDRAVVMEQGTIASDFVSALFAFFAAFAFEL